jgi:hypothetical protein
MDTFFFGSFAGLWRSFEFRLGNHPSGRYGALSPRKEIQ